MTIAAIRVKNGLPAASPRARSSSRRAGVPVMDVEHVERHAVALDRRQRRLAEQAEPPRVVRVVVVRRRDRTPRGRRPAAAGSRRAATSMIPASIGAAAVRVGDGDRGHALASRRERHRPVAGQEHVDRASRAPCRPRSRPRARASASTTSPSPPVFAHGSHSAAMSATRNRHRPMLPAGRSVPRARDVRCERRGLNRFTIGAIGICLCMCRSWSPSSRSRGARRLFRLPPQLEGLRRIAYNLWWTWHPQARSCSGGSTPALGALPHPDPRALGPRRLGPAALQPGVHGRVRGDPARVRRLHGERRGLLVPPRPRRRAASGPIAYFCAEYGFHESLGIYSGGLGVLAGDHMKTACDMALPFVGVGLLYRKRLLPPDDRRRRPPGARLPELRPLAAAGPAGDRPAGEPLTRQRGAARPRPERRRLVRPGRPRAGPAARHRPPRERRLRPADHPHPVRPGPRDAPPPGARPRRRRRARAPRPRHRARRLAPQRGPLRVPARRARAGARRGRPDARRGLDRGPARRVFTIHTPVSAGNERFDADLVRRVAGPLLEGDGRPNTGGVPIERGARARAAASMATSREFDMTAFSLRLTRGANAVSQLHGRDREPDLAGRHARPNPRHHQRRPHADLGRPADARPRALLGADLDSLDDKAGERRFWERVDQVPGAELWEAHQRQKLELALFARGRLRNQFARHGESPTTLEQLEHVLDPSILTIGFARRFATYKRAGLLFTDIERLARMLSDERAAGPDHLRRQGPSGRPARPAGDPGHLRPVAQPAAPGPRVHPRGLRHPDRPVPRPGRRRLAQQPAPPARGLGHARHEGAANGVPNLSVLDGWWDEGWTGDNGWAIGGRETHPDEGAQDWADAQDLYRLLEEELVPRLLPARRGRPARALGRADA